MMLYNASGVNDGKNRYRGLSDSDHSSESLTMPKTCSGEE